MFPEKWYPQGCWAGDKFQVIPIPGENTQHKQLHPHLSLPLGFPEDVEEENDDIFLPCGGFWGVIPAKGGLQDRGGWVGGM